jgi:lipopolysaccharide cholinephosphotransferase
MTTPKSPMNFALKSYKNGTVFNHDIAEQLLLDITQRLDSHNVPYHLEGGTLLGIVRDNALLPWDDDLDISIPAGYEKQAAIALRPIMLKGWRIDKRKLYRFDAITKSGPRVYKIRDRSRGLLNMGHSYLDIFVKYEQDGFVYWQAKRKLMRVESIHYDGYEEVEFKGHVLKAPNQYRDYLTKKYGDWSVPVKEWDCGKQEKTIIE